MRTCSKALVLAALAGCGGSKTTVQSDAGPPSGGPYLPEGDFLMCSGVQKVSGVDPSTGNVICTDDVDTDTDTNTEYTPGDGLALDGTTFSVAFSDLTCAGSDKVTGFAAGVPICAPDQQSVTTQVPRNNSLVTVDPDTNTGRYTSITIGADGLPVMSYRDGGSAGDLRVAKCLDAACIGPAAITVVDGLVDDVGDYTSIAIGADGYPVISYYDATNTVLKVAKCVDVACVMPVSPEVVDGGANDVGHRTSIAVGVDGLPLISYYDVTNGNLKVAHCTVANCAASTSLITTLDGMSGDVGSYNSIAIGIDGRAIISYYSATDTALWAAKCGDTACSLGNVINAVDAVGSVGRYNSITIGTDGLPIISYRDSTSGGLKVVRCADAACATVVGPPTPVDAAGTPDVQDTSITIGTDGLPIIAYYEAVAASLRVAKCGDVGCTANNTTVTVDSGFVGENPSITIGSDGRPIISYRGPNVLKVAQCVNQFCLPFWTRR